MENPEKNRGGRPRKPVDVEVIRKLAALGCTNAEIGAWFELDESTIRKGYSEIVKLGRETGRTTLRRLQWKRCHKGSDVMLIHLGKQLLGQAEKVDQTVYNNPVVVEMPPKDGDDQTTTDADDQSTTGPAAEIPGQLS